MPLGKSIGLLQKANLLAQKQGLAFCDFISKNNIKYFAKFSLIDNYFYITNSYNFDAASIIGSKSTVDFWEGVAPEKNKIFNFDNQTKSITTLLQFFSFAIKDKIETIQIIREASSIFMICNSSISDEVISDLVTLREEFPNIKHDSDTFSKDSIIYKFEINLKDAVENYISDMEISESLSNTITKSLYNEISNSLYFIFSNNNIIGKVNDFTYRVGLTTVNELNKSLIKKHIIMNLSRILENYSTIINIEEKGTSETYSDLLNFVKAE